MLSPQVWKTNSYLSFGPPDLKTVKLDAKAINPLMNENSSGGSGDNPSSDDKVPTTTGATRTSPAEGGKIHIRSFLIFQHLYFNSFN